MSRRRSRRVFGSGVVVINPLSLGLLRGFDARLGSTIIKAGGGVAANNDLVQSWLNRNTTDVIVSVDQMTDTPGVASQPKLLTAGLNGGPCLQALDHFCLLDNSSANAFASGAARTAFVVAQADDANGGHLFTYRRSNGELAISLMSSISTSSISPLYWYTSSDGISENHQMNPPPSISSPFVLAIAYQTGNTIHSAWHNGRRIALSSQTMTDAILSVADDGGTGFTLFNRVQTLANPYGWRGKIGCFYDFAGIMSPDLITAFSQSLARGWGFAGSVVTLPSLKKLVAFDGDSITRGNGSSSAATGSYPAQTAALLGSSWDAYNFGIDGAGTTDTRYRRARSVDIHLNLGRPAYVYYEACGTNDLRNGATAAQVYDQINQNVTAAKAAGWKTIVSTVLGRVVGQLGWDAGMETARVSLNALINANAAGANAVVDHTGTARLETPVDMMTDFPDSLHPSDVACALIATNAAPVIAGV